MGLVTVGVDIGQRVDPTAIVVAEDELRARPERPRHEEVHFLVRHLERLPLGTPYPDVARRVADVVRGARQQTTGSCVLYVDATGVGLPVVDLLRATGMAAAITPVWFTHGDRRSEDQDGVKLGKAYLVSRVQALLQTQRIHLPKLSEAQALVDELLAYEIRVDEQANDRYGAFTVGSHDDLVTALGLAVQVDPVYGGSWADVKRRAPPSILLAGRARW